MTPCPARTSHLPNNTRWITGPFSRLLRCEDPELDRFLKVGRECSLVRIDISSAEKEGFLVGLDARCFQCNGDRNVVCERVMLVGDKSLLHDHVRLRF